MVIISIQLFFKSCKDQSAQYQHNNREDAVMSHKPYSNAELALDNSRNRL